MNKIIETFIERKDDLFKALIQHVSISLTALIIAVIIALPLAIFFSRYKKGAEFILQVTSVLQTIPSLALLGLLIPFVGIGTTPALIALIIYALLPIFQSTYIGLSEIDPSLEEAGTAFGMSRMQKLVKFELPIAMPVIISGIRTALVLIIGTATLAALVGAGGLGSFILLGIDRNDPSLTIIGATCSALLAIIFSSFIKFLQNKSFKTIILVMLSFILLISGGVLVKNINNRQAKTITIAGKLGAEPEIIINMYKELIEEENPNVDVKLKENFGKTSFLFNALKAGQIDIYPEFTGTVLESLVDVPHETKIDKSAEGTYKLAKELLKKEDNMAYLEPMEYENTYALAVKKEFADSNNLKDISDLKKISQNLKGGFTLEFIDREDGLKGIEKTYNIGIPSVQSMEPALRYQAINKGDINLIDAYSTDSEIRQYNLVTLKDDKGIFPAYQGAPLMTQKFKDANPEVVKALDMLAGRVTEDQMIEMNYQVNVKGRKTHDVAHDYLVKEGLVGEKK
ncbi:glycine/betaine ABC transporter permease [Floricoccus tropicus]|uniref:Glycine/betaine ABC transporter permease n=1 Tax=Floricoccus tropicus TaxID=1859473 RepID=A0A1E8GJK0_9LACT|nr:ABC transporter permease/substrate-binding protein [Floricoccus tropicus]OFI48434.1 glycine/betaine ABC transporter permease [Floricoccus tropicus]